VNIFLKNRLYDTLGTLYVVVMCTINCSNKNNLTVVLKCVMSCLIKLLDSISINDYPCVLNKMILKSNVTLFSVKK